MSCYGLNIRSTDRQIFKLLIAIHRDVVSVTTRQRNYVGSKFELISAPNYAMLSANQFRPHRWNHLAEYTHIRNSHRTTTRCFHCTTLARGSQWNRQPDGWGSPHPKQTATSVQLHTHRFALVLFYLLLFTERIEFPKCIDAEPRQSVVEYPMRRPSNAVDRPSVVLDGDDVANR